MSIKDYFKPISVDKSIVIASSETANLNPREEGKVIKSIEGIQSGGGGVYESKFFKHKFNLLYICFVISYYYILNKFS